MPDEQTNARHKFVLLTGADRTRRCATCGLCACLHVNCGDRDRFLATHSWRPMRHFPVLRSQSELSREITSRWPSSIPWSFVEKFRERAENNHDQSLERLAERGGLAPEELWLAAHDQPLSRFKQTVVPPCEKDCGEWLIAEMKKLGR